MSAKKTPQKATPPKKLTPPDQRPITTIQAGRLAALAGVPAKGLEGKTIAQLSEILKGIIDPALFLFVEICGQVVQPNPATGVACPVPFATVSVEDTVCNFVGYFPGGWPWCWLFPYRCQTEVITTTTTDQCGNFCVWVPRFDVEWIRTWKSERICFPTIFRRPTIGDLLSKIPPPAAGPAPDPLDVLTSLSPSTLEAVAGPAAGPLAQKVARLKSAQVFGSPNPVTKALLNARAFENEMPPPLPAEFRQALAGKTHVVAAKGASATEGIRSAIALKLGLSPAAKELSGFDPGNFIGPFFQCYDIFIPEWQAILSVPDICFQVTQNINNVQQTIYSGGYFEVPWSTENLTGVTLSASSNAIAACGCNLPPPPTGPCAVPAIIAAGAMDLTTIAGFFNGSFTPASGTFTLPTVASPYGSLSSLPAPAFDATLGLGCAVGPNQALPTSPTPPIPSGLTSPPSALTTAPAGCPSWPPPGPLVPAGAPFYGGLSLTGCVDAPNAVYYRVMQSTDNGQTFIPMIVPPFLNIEMLPTPGVSLSLVPDLNGWYAVNPIDSMGNTVARANLAWPNLIIVWPTPSSGLSVLYVQVADVNKKLIAPTAPPPMAAFQIDNTAPTVTFNSIMWKVSGQPDSTLTPLTINDCPLIQTLGQAIEIVVSASVTALHLRSACLFASGCGGTSLDIIYDANNYSNYWYALGGSQSGNTVSLYQRYYLPANATAGCYSFGCYAASRSMNPSADDSGESTTPPWVFYPSDVYVIPSIAVAIVGG